MSLINEALKKARREAGYQGDRRLGVLVPSHVRPRRPVVPWVVAAVSIGLAAGVIVGAVLLGSDEPEPPTAGLPAEPRAVSPAVVSPSETEEDAAPAPEASAPAGESRRETVPPPETPESAEPPAPEPVPWQVPRQADPPPYAAPDPTEPAAKPGPRDGDSFLRSVPLPEGIELVLNGIAWSETGPVALLNGRAVEQGEYVEGWRVALIERRQVSLSSGEITITLRLK